MNEPTIPEADMKIVNELVRVNRDIVRAIALVKSGAPDSESAELIEVAESHLDTGMKLLTRAAIDPRDRPHA
jgi:hypothetical protein